MTASSSTSTLCPILIGRSLHLEVLAQVIEQTGDRVGKTVLIAGEAGIGKSRLAVEAKTLAAQRGFQILQGNCFEPDRSLPYAPLLDLLRSFCANLSNAEIASTFGPGSPDFIKLLPELSTRLPAFTPTPVLEPEAEKQRLFSALLRFFTGGGAPNANPILIVIEDLQWSDETSLEFLLHLARRIVAQPIILLLTYRSDEIHPALNHFLAELDRERLTVELMLQHLTMTEVDGMLRAIFGMERPVGSEFRQTLYSHTDGNPFFLEETLQALTASGSIFLERGHWNHKPVDEWQIPRSIQDTVRRRSEHLSGAARNLLDLAAVAGRRFDFGLLQELTELDEQKLLVLMKELVAAQLVAEETADQFSFRHALTREAVYQGLLIRERKRYHGQVAGIIERMHASSLEPHAGNLAYHFYEAGVWDKALVYSRQAGEKAQALFAPHAALDQFTRALEAAQQLAVSLPILYHELGQACETIGEFDRARANYELALTSSKELQDDRSEWQALIDLGSLWAGRDYPRAGAYFQKALDLAHQMGDPSTLAHCLNRLGNWHANVGDLSEALRHHKQALEVFQESNDRHGLAETLDLLGTVSQINGDLVGGVGYYQRAVELFRELDDRQGLVSILATLALCGPSYMHELSISPLNLAQAVENGEAALKIAREIGWRSGEDFTLFCLSICLGPQGEYQRALELVEQARQISEEIEHQEWRIAAQCVLGALYLELFALPPARQHLELALTQAKEIGSSVWIGTVTGYLASVCILQNELPRAKEVLDAELAPETPAQTQMQRLCWCARAELALARAQPELALAVVERLIGSDPNITPGAAIPRLSVLRSQALAALQRPEEAEKELQLAKAAALGQGARSWGWRIQLALGKLYQSQMRRSEAEAAFSTAKEIIQALGAPLRDQTLRELFLKHALSILPIPAAISPQQVEKDKFGGLTAREREVAALIARGMSNRGIAEELVVSERTVETHITNILAKLDFSSRAAIAVWAINKGLGK